MGGTASIVFIFFYIMIDVLNFWNGSPFRYPGEHTYKCSKDVLTPDNEVLLVVQALMCLPTINNIIACLI